MRRVYIHVPFCSSICSYCDFCKFLHNDIWASEYLIHLEKEINKYYDNDEVASIYIGGGTPSTLSIDNIKKLMDIVKVFKRKKNIEFTFEMNINDIEEEKLLILKNNGVNRISIGVESFDKNNLQFLNRKHTKRDIVNNINIVKNYFDNINIDLIYALPIENMNILKSDISSMLKLKVNHISTYSLIIENNTVLGVKNIKPIEEEKDAKMYKYIVKKLKSKGYIHYEVSNFARKGYESKHNLGYWNNQEYYGFGLGASGYISELRYENTRSFNEYLKDNYRLNELVMSKKEDMENYVMLGLRKLEGINAKDFFDRYKENVQDVFNIKPLLKEGLLKTNKTNIYIPEDKIYVMNYILNKIFN